MTLSHARALAVGLLSLALQPFTALAEWPTSPLVNVPVCIVPGQQTQYSLISDGVGGMIAIWQDTRSGVEDIYAQRLSAGAFALWMANGSPVCVASGAQLYPEAISDGEGGAIVVWQDGRNGAADDIYAQRIDASGLMRWTAGGVPLCAFAGHQGQPTLVPDGAGGAVVVWSDQRVSPQNHFYYAQRVDRDGNPQWTVDGVALATDLYFTRPAIAPADSGGVIVTWTTNSGIPHPRVQRLDGSGQPRWGSNGLPLANVSAQFGPRIVSDGSGGAIIAWADYRGGDGLTTTTFAQRVDASGMPQWAANGVAVSSSSGDQQYQAVVSDGEAGAVVVWTDLSTTAIFAQQVNSSGVPQWAPAGVLVCSGSGEKQVNRIQSDGAGGVLVPWSDYRVGGGDVYVQRVSAVGVPLWTVDGVATCTANYVQGSPMLIPDGTGGAFVAWSDHRDGDNWHVYAQRVTSGGVLGGGSLGAPGARAPEAISVSCAGANPHRGALVIDCSLGSAKTAVVSLFDVSGRCLESQVLRDPSAGVQRVTFGATGASRAPGVYQVRLTQAGRFAMTRLVLVR